MATEGSASAVCESGAARHEQKGWRRLAAAGSNLSKGVLIAAIVLGLVRAAAIGRDAEVGAGLAISAATALGSEKVGWLTFRWPAFVVAALIAVPVGLVGKAYFADRPVDVTAQLRLKPLNGESGATSDAYTAALNVPPNMRLLQLRLALVDVAPATGSCAETSYEARWLGAPGPADPTGSGDVADVPIPATIRRIQLLITVNPAPSCDGIDVYPESAMFFDH